MKSPFDHRDVWFLTGSVDLYGGEALTKVADQSRKIADQLAAEGHLPLKIVWKPVLKDRDGILRVMREANLDQSCVGVIAWMHTFSPAKMWIQGLDALDKPLLHLHTQFAAELPWASIDMDFMNLNQSAHGDREFAFMETRLGAARTSVAGHVSQPQVRQRIATWMRAAAGRAELRSLRVVRFGDNMRNVGVTEGDKVEAEHVFGSSVNTWGVADLVDGIDRVSDAEAKALAAAYDDQYRVVGELSPGGERRGDLLYAAKQELALRSFLEQQGAWALTDTFEDLGDLVQLPGLAIQRLMADGYGFGAEGDWKTALLVRAAKVMGHGLAGGSSLMEDYTYHLVPGEEKVLGAHMLEICPSLTTSTPSLEIHPLSIGNRSDPVRLVFDADPGPAMVLGLCDLGDRFRLTANQVQVVPPDQPMPNLPVARAVWRPEPALSTSATCWMMAGAPHHTLLTQSVPREVIEDLAEMLGVELLVIDQSTTERAFAKELRWNSAYYRMKRPLR
ncbi:MAG: L-arabinose isomerase [Bifidobacteriaceae bacterium]|jgi:L-arabinose isomerase|nr:L-arabinose isomerase [Bifidobacteriaceae bacterium]